MLGEQKNGSVVVGYDIGGGLKKNISSLYQV